MNQVKSIKHAERILLTYLWTGINYNEYLQEYYYGADKPSKIDLKRIEKASSNISDIIFNLYNSRNKYQDKIKSIQ